MNIVLKLFGIVCWFVDLGGLLYFFGVGRDHWGINWQGMSTIVWLSAILLVILAASALLAWCGYFRWAVLVAAAPGILAVGTFAVVAGIYLFAGGSH